jgi:hypothetical protein
VRFRRHRCIRAALSRRSKGATALKSFTFLTLSSGPHCFRPYARGMVAWSQRSLHAAGVTLEVAEVIDSKDLSATPESEVLA